MSGSASVRHRFLADGASARSTERHRDAAGTTERSDGEGVGEGGASPRPTPWRYPHWRQRQWMAAAQRRARGKSVLWEQKTTGNRQYTIKEDDWEKLRKNALLDGRIPKLHITLGAKKRRLVVMEEGDHDEANDPPTALYAG